MKSIVTHLIFISKKVKGPMPAEVAWLFRTGQYERGPMIFERWETVYPEAAPSSHLMKWEFGGKKT